MRSRWRGRYAWHLGVFFVSVVVLCIPAGAQNQRPLVGRNVNMVSGTGWPNGDPFLQRQNEPSIAVSTRNPQHLLAGANDYRTVDVPFDVDTDDEKKGDA